MLDFMKIITIVTKMVLPLFLFEPYKSMNSAHELINFLKMIIRFSKIGLIIII